MNVKFSLTIFLGIWTLAISQDFNGSPAAKPHKRHTSLAALIKQMRPKTFKRSSGISSHLPSHSATRILNKPPLNLLQNGPYYINHYIYCDNLDQHNLDQIKAGTLAANKEIQLLNLHKDDFHNFGGIKPFSGSNGLDGFKTTTYTGDKELHILHLPKDKPHDFKDVSVHLSLLNAHESSNAPDIDLDLNKHFGNFEVNLESIKPLDIDTSHLPTTVTKSPINDIVTPLVQGIFPGGQNHKYNHNLIQLADYLNNKPEHIQQPYGDSESSQETNKEILDLPHFEKHPLEHDPSKSSYDTPGAVDSYGHPAIHSYGIGDSYSNLNPGSNNHPNLAHVIPNEQYAFGSSSKDFQNNENGLNSGFGNGFKGNDLYQTADYIGQLNNDLQRKRRDGEKISSN